MSGCDCDHEHDYDREDENENDQLHSLHHVSENGK